MKRLIICLFLAVPCLTSAQIDSVKFDSLKSLLTGKISTDRRIKIYIDIGILMEGRDFVSGLAYADTAVQLSTKYKNDKRKAEAKVVLGNIYWYLGDTDKSMELYLSSLKIREKIKDVRGIGISKYNISLLFNALGNYPEAIRYAEESNKQFVSPDLVDDLCMGYIHLSTLYEELDSSAKEKFYFEKAFKLLPKLKDNHVISSVYLHKGAFFKTEQQFDSAKFYYEKSYYYDSVGNNIYGMTAILNNIGLMYAMSGDLDKAIYYTVRSASISEKNDVKLSLKYSYGNLADYYSEKGDYKTAYSFIRKFIELTRVLYSEENQRIGNEMEAKFQDEKKMLIIEKQKQESLAKDAKIETQEQENKRISQQRIFIGVALVLMFLVALLIFRNLQRKKKDNRLITEQKEEIALQKEELQERHTEIKDSIDYARRIQTALLTSDEYWDEISKDHFVLFRPKDVVSGDFFWAFHTESPEGNLAVWCAADCTGHGVPGAFMSMLGISFLNEVVIEQGNYKADIILEKLREKIIKSLMKKKGEVKQRDGMDIALCVWNKKSNMLEFAGANNPLWIVRKTNGKPELIEIKPAKIPVGLFGDELEPFVKESIQLLPGDMIYSFSDGFADQFGGPKGKKLRYVNFKNMLLEISGLESKKQKSILAEKFDLWKGELEQIDDICVVGIKI